MTKQNLRTGEVADRAGVSIATLRYYERRGLIPPPSRTASGYRAFDPGTVRTVRLIKRAQALGFTLKEIHRLLSIVRNDKGTCADLHELGRDKLFDLDQQLESLSQKRELLGELLETCPNDTAQSADECPFLVGLESGGNGVDDASTG